MGRPRNHPIMEFPDIPTMLPDMRSRLWRFLVGSICAVFLLFNLSACGAANEPPRQQLLQALSLQIQLTQAAISRSLELPDSSGTPTVSRVRIENQEAIQIGEQLGMKVSGRFDWQLPGDRMQVDSPFEIYMERGERGESWRLARPGGSGDGFRQDWLTYPLPVS
ncbi:MAG: hypothetical protein CBB80_001050 [Synechococcus sp. TMED20]|nr:MAG: hypothetical protein CBB80_001050 [Synechococcus sp. TMED20]|tara:strand:- start:150 stop:644 length:495 start_codon:yes stop_codon:yes gene_type:complete